jgi:ABC-type sugar transport system substrate-binding protein
MHITLKSRRLTISIVTRSQGMFILPILAVILSTGCGKPETDGKPQIGGILFQEDQFFRMIEIGMKDAAQRRDVHLSVNNSRNGPDEELRLIDTYIVRGMDAIVISPLSGKASIPALQRAHEKGIKIITYNTVLEADFPLAYIESDQAELGAITGRAVKQHIEQKLEGKANVAILSFETQHPETGGARVRVFLSQIEQLPGVKIVAKQDAWLQPDADNAVSSILTAHPDLDIVWAANEGGTVGAVTAVKNAQKAGQVFVFGTDMSRQLADFLLTDDILQAVTAQKPLEIGAMAVDAAVDVLEGKTVEKKVSLPGELFSRQSPDEIEKYRQRMEELGK